jgi:hypothetical protein
MQWKKSIQARSKTVLAAIALLALGTMFGPLANAGCGKYESTGQKASSLRSLGSSSAQYRFIRTGYQQIADVEKSDSASQNAASITGLWNFKYIAEGNATVPDGTVIDGGYTAWYSDGNELTSSAMRAPDTGSICLGVWEQTGAATYKLNHIGLSWDPVNNVFVGPAFIKQNVTLETGGMKYSGTFNITQFAADGKTVLAKVKGLIFADRVTVDTI